MAILYIYILLMQN